MVKPLCRVEVSFNGSRANESHNYLGFVGPLVEATSVMWLRRTPPPPPAASLRTARLHPSSPPFIPAAPHHH